MVGNPKSHNSATSEMVKLAGQVVTISATDYGQYRVFECSRWLYWTDEMFDGLADDGVAFELDLEDIFSGGMRMIASIEKRLKQLERNFLRSCVQELFHIFQ